MSKRIILFVASLAVIIGLMTSGTSYAWFATSTHKKQNISVSVVSNTYSANISDITIPEKIIVLQGDNLVNLDGRSAALNLQNNSTTNTQLRISVEYTSYRNGSAEQVVYSGSEEDDIVVNFTDNKWAKSVNAAGICYYYYMGDEAHNGAIENTDEVPSITPNDKIINAVSEIYYKDSIPYSYSGQNINVKVTFESKQAENITWSAIDTYDVTGVGK